MISNEHSTAFTTSFGKGLRPIDTRPLWEWLHEACPLPNVFNPPGRFNIDFYPYLRRPMEDLLDDAGCKQLNLAACTQAGKSLLQQVFIPYIILESPGPCLMIHDTQDNAKRVAEERIIPLLKNNPDIKRMLNLSRFAARKTGIQLPHMTFRISGPAESNILGYSAKIVLADEIWRWQADGHKGVIEKLKNRQSAFNATRKMVLAGQPDFEGSDWHKECTKGFWWEWGYKCPKCHTLQLYEWNGEKDGKFFGMIFDKTEEDEEEKPNYDKKAASARLVCQHCFHEIADTPTNRAELMSNGDYILIHKGNDSSIHTYSWSQFCNRSVPFKQISLAYFDAVIEKRTLGLRIKHELFRTQTLGKFWKFGQQVDTRKLMTEAYSSSEEWPDETIRFLTLDPQKDYINFLVRAWSNKVPECRLIDWGTCAGFSEVEEIITKYKIHPLCVGIDSGNDTREVYKESVQHGKVITLKNGKRMLAQWTCLRGDGGIVFPKKFYRHKILEPNGKTIDIDKLYSELSLVDCQWPQTSKFKMCRANLYTWSNFSVKSVLQKLRDSQLPFRWKLNERANADYNKQMFSEELNKKSGRYEQIGDTPNHVWDMECMQLVMALQSSTYCPSASDMNELTKEEEAPKV